MAYIDRRSGTNRATSLITVGAIHAAMGAALIYGLAPGVVEMIKPTRIISVDIPVPPEATPPIEPDKTETSAPSVITAPTPPIDFFPSPQPAEPMTPLEPFAPNLPTAQPSATPSELPKPDKPLFTPRSPHAANDQARWVTASDYPGRDLRAGNEGVTGFRLVIGSNGKVQACETTSSSGFASLDKAACDRITSRARFEAAINGSGEKVVGTFNGSVRWQIPK